MLTTTVTAKTSFKEEFSGEDQGSSALCALTTGAGRYTQVTFNQNARTMNILISNLLILFCIS